MKIILGGGIAGLIFAFYNKEYTVISPDIGGQMNYCFPLGARYLHRTADSEKFLFDTCMNFRQKTIHVGHWDNFWIEVPDERFRKDYYKKSRGIDNLDGYESTVMSRNDKSFIALTVNFPKLIEVLASEISLRTIKDTVVKIDPAMKTIFLKSGKRIDYSSLVSTIPKNVFLKLCSLPHSHLVSKPTTFVLLKGNYFKSGRFDYVYIPTSGILHHRLTCDRKGIVAEIQGEASVGMLKDYYKNFYIDSKVIYNSQIIGAKSNEKFDGVTFFGRYGCWDRSWKTEKVITESMLNSKEKK